MEQEDKEFFILVLGVLAAIILVISWWFASNGGAVTSQPTSSASASTTQDTSDPGTAEATPTPEPTTAPTPTATPVPAPVATAPSVFDAIAADPNLSVLTGLLRTENLDQVLASGDAFTVFAPSDDAVSQAASSDTTVSVLESAATDVLTYHVVPESYSFDDLAEIARGVRSTDLMTVQGELLTLTIEGESVVINGSAALTGEPIVTDNGIVHTIDDVLVPSVAALNTLVAQEPILFASGSADIDPASFATLDQFIEVLGKSSANVSIEGHTDSSGDAILNQNLSQGRARAVLNYLVANGVDESRLSAVGFGSSQPVADNESEEGRALNRRIEFTLD